jgi:DNA (cytosine-5)-methyltransferase 1
VIGGPPCQKFSGLANLARARGVEFQNLIPEFERCVREAQPDWFLMENVQAAPAPVVEGYVVHGQVLNNRWCGEGFGGEQNRVRRFSFGTRTGARLPLAVAALEPLAWAHAVTAAHAGDRRVRSKGKIARYAVPEAARLQGLPADFLEDAPFTQQGKLKVIANGVPLPMGRAIARGVRRAMHSEHIGA